jgi:hypothetical protein
MRRIAIFFVVLAFSLGSVSALSTTLGEAYEPSETMIGKLSDDIHAVNVKNARILRDGHIDVGFNGDIKKLGNSYFIWILAPLNSGNYKLVVGNVITNVGDVLNLEHEFVVGKEKSEYSITPGFIVSSEDFEIVANLNVDFGKTINVDYPSFRNVSLTPGSNKINIQIGKVIGNKLVMISVGKYLVPAFLIGKQSVCGDGEIHNEEVCDGSNLRSESCSTRGFDSGELTCLSNCLSFNTSLCKVTPVCDSVNLDLCSSDSSCSSAGGFWYGGYTKKCNRYEKGAECDSEHTGLCTTAGTCLDAGGFWYDGECKEKSCDSNNLKLCESVSDCLSAEGYWYSGICNSEDEVNVAPKFEFSDAVIRSSVLASQSIPIYSFQLRNVGENRIKNIFLEYNREKFIVFPDAEIVLKPEENVNISLSLKTPIEFPLKGAIIAYAGNFSDYILIEIDSTENEKNVETVYLDDEEGPGYYCSELGGIICVDEEVCSEEAVESIGGNCCLAECKIGNRGSRVWIGYLTVVLIILVLLIVYVKYKKAGKPPNVLTEKRFSMAEKKLP